MSRLLDGELIELPCGKCGRKTKKSVRWVKDNRQFTCTCGTVNRFDSGQFRKTLEGIDRAASDLPGLSSLFK